MTIQALVGPLVPVATRSIVIKALRDAVIAAGMSKAIETGVGYFGDKSDAEIPATPASELIADINFAPVITVTPTQANKFVLASDVINEATGGNAALQAKLNADVNGEYGQQLDAAFPNQDEWVAQAMKESLKNTADEASLGSDGKAGLKAATRKATDRYYVSMQYHEWQHCTRPNKTGVTPIDLLASVAQKSTSRQPTFGEFVDDTQMRKGIELYRRVFRVTTGDGFKSLAELAGTTLDALRTQIFAETGNAILLDQATSNSDYFNQ